MKRILIPISSAAGMWVCQMASAPAWGQTEDRPTVLQEVIVTAEKREASLQDTPIAVTAMTSERINTLGVNQIDDVTRNVPNVTFTRPLGSPGAFVMSIRGMALADPLLTLDPTVGLYQDGIYIARQAGAAFDLIDLERIEVLRGPQGALYGRNTVGGAVRRRKLIKVSML